MADQPLCPAKQKHWMSSPGLSPSRPDEEGREHQWPLECRARPERIHVAVRVGDHLYRNSHVARKGKDVLRLVTRIDHDRLPSPTGADQPAVFGEHADYYTPDHQLSNFGLRHSLNNLLDTFSLPDRSILPTMTIDRSPTSSITTSFDLVAIN